MEVAGDNEQTADNETCYLPSSLLRLWIFALPITQKSRLSGVLRTFGSMQFAG
jgi:hypothetical protein